MVVNNENQTQTHVHWYVHTPLRLFTVKYPLTEMGVAHTLISLINVEVEINVEGVQKLQNQ